MRLQLMVFQLLVTSSARYFSVETLKNVVNVKYPTNLHFGFNVFLYESIILPLTSM